MNDQPEVDWVESRQRPTRPAPSQRDPELAAALNEQRRQSYNAETLRTRPAPRSDTPSDERHPGYPHQPGEPLTLDLTVDLARPAPSPVPEASGRGEVVQPTMHILRRADGEEMGEFAFWATDGPDGWDMAEDNDHDEDTVYEILACYPVARRKILWSTLCETCDGEGDGCPACAGSGECEPPDAEHMPIIARPAPSSSPVGRVLDECSHGITLAQVTERCAECGTVVAQGPAPMMPLDVTALPEWSALVEANERRGDLSALDYLATWPAPDLRIARAARALLAAADRGEPTP